jgi:hypothetical protein
VALAEKAEQFSVHRAGAKQCARQSTSPEDRARNKNPLGFPGLLFCLFIKKLMRHGKGDYFSRAGFPEDFSRFRQGRSSGGDIVNQNYIFVFYFCLPAIFYGKRADKIFQSFPPVSDPRLMLGVFWLY